MYLPERLEIIKLSTFSWSEVGVDAVWGVWGEEMEEDFTAPPMVAAVSLPLLLNENFCFGVMAFRISDSLSERPRIC